MNTKQLLNSVLLCIAILFTAAQINAQPAFMQRTHSASHGMLPQYDTATHKVIWTSNYNSEIQAPKTPTEFIQSATTGSNYHLTKDINKATDGDPSNYSFGQVFPTYAVLNNIAYFVADDGVHGSELWRSNGTPAGTSMVKDINPGAGSSSPWQITVFNGKLYFAALTEDAGSEMWVSDGTAAGTHLLKDVSTGTASSNPFNIFAAGNYVYFTVNDGIAYDDVLWKTDGTEAGTVLVKNLYTSADNYSYNIFQMTAANNLLYFTAYSTTNGRELWRSDGTTSGTYIVRDINPNNFGDYDGPSFLTAYNNHLYFVANDGTGRKLWLTDGTYASTALAPGGNGVTFQDTYYFYLANLPFQIMNNTLYMYAYSPTTGSEMYQYNASNGQGLVVLKNISTDAAGTNIDYTSIVAVNNTLYFYVVNPDITYSLWASAGTSATTRSVKTFGNLETASQFTGSNGILYFTKYDSTIGTELWKSDATTSGTVAVKNINAGKYSAYPTYITPFHNGVMFMATTLSNGYELWGSDGTAQGTKQIKDLNSTTTAGAYPMLYDNSAPFLNGILFTAFSPQYGNELYKSDGTAAGTTMIGDIFPGENSSDVRNVTVKGNLAYFIAHTSISPNVYSIYKTDGSTLIKIIDVPIGAYVSSIAVTDNGFVFYLMYNPQSFQEELWRTDGTAIGTIMLASGVNSGTYPLAVGNTVFFCGSDGNGSELWKSNGTVAGTKMVKDIYFGPGSSSPYSLIAFNNTVYFGAFDGSSTSNSLWKTNGTAAGTVKLSNVSPAWAFSFRETSKYFCEAGNYLFFNGTTSDNGAELWRTNGTVNGTKMVKDIYAGSGYSTPFNLVNVNGVVFFTAYDADHGTELWATKGTAASTVLVADLTAGSGSSYINSIVSTGEKCFFGFNGQLWSSDTSLHTNVVADASNITSVYQLLNNGNKVFFGGYEYATGDELYEGNAAVAAVAKTNESQNALAVESFGVKLTPNPVTSYATLELSGKTKNARIKLTDISGAVLWTAIADNTNRINIPAQRLTAGTYTISVTVGDKTKTVRFIKL